MLTLKIILLFFMGKVMLPNYTRYKNAKFDSLYEIAVAETDAGIRQQLYYSMDSMLIRDAPVIPLFYDEVYRFTQKNIEGLEPNALNMLELKRVKKFNINR